MIVAATLFTFQVVATGRERNFVLTDILTGYPV
jgi:hypothetical protein